LLHQVGDLLELNVKLRCQKVNLDLTGMIQFLGPRVNNLKIPTRDPDSTSGERNQLVTMFLENRQIAIPIF